MVESEPVGAALPGTYRAVCSLVADLSPGRILDAPCGAGGLARLLSQAGHSLVGADLHLMPPSHLYRGVRLDLNAPLPFLDGVFDAVVSVEGIEHLENPYLPVREFSRILRPGGRLVISTPNILNMRSRVKFFLLGTLFWFDSGGYRPASHVNAIPIYELRHLLAEAGFAVERISVNRRSSGMRIVEAVMGPLLRAVAWLRRSPADLNAADLLCGEVVIILGQKLNPLDVPEVAMGEPLLARGRGRRATA
jgi:SAM-dependent methyltransferase